jgi:MFS family permease
LNGFVDRLILRLDGRTGAQADPSHGVSVTVGGLIRALAFPVYLPTLLIATGEGAVVAVIALVARSLGASTATAGLIVALAGIGVLLFDLPSGWLISRFGEGTSILVGTIVLVAALAGCATVDSVPLLGVATLAMGCGWSVWILARLNYVGDVVPYAFRGRALSTLGGTWRIGLFVGPFAGAGLIALTGLRSVYVLHGALAVAAAAVMLTALRKSGAGSHEVEPISLLTTLAHHRRVFVTAGTAVAGISAMRAIRQALVPLWAIHIGLSAEAASIVFGISIGMEVAMFYPAGLLMDRIGRKPIATGCVACIALGLFLMPLAHDTTVFLAVAVVIGVGNGLGSGIVMTLGVDLSPAANRAQFLGVWRVCSDIGGAVGPLLVAAIIAATTLGASATVAGCLGVASCATVLALLPETRATPATPATR